MALTALSLFDGKSSAYTACELAGIPLAKFYSSEIDSHAIKVSDAIHPDQSRLGDILNWRNWNIDWTKIDIVFAGFPCQAWSMAGKQLGDKDERGMLFWTMLDVIKHIKNMKRIFTGSDHVDFLIENVKMKKEFEEYITYHTEQSLGSVHKTLINSALVSAQNRNRYYWTSFPVTQPEDRCIVLADIIESESDFESKSSGWHKWWVENSERQLSKGYSAICNDGSRDKAICMTARQYASWTGNLVKCARIVGRQLVFVDKSQTLLATIYKENAKSMVQRNKKGLLVGSESHDFGQFNKDGIHYRKLTPRECFRLQTVPEHYIDKILECGVSDSQLYKIAGNGWTDEVIAHILRCKQWH